MFAVVFLEAVALHLESAPADDPNYEGMTTYFSSLPMAVLTLFMTITGGVSWWDVAKLFLDVSSFFVVVFALFVVIMLLAVLNIITGIFVSDAVDRASRDRDIMTDMKKERAAANMRVLRSLFHEMDKDRSGCLNLDELANMLQSDEIHSVMTMLDLEVSDAVSFFKLLDVDDSGRVEIDEFVMGCLRYMGKAKPVDIETLTQENRRMMDRYNRQTARIEDGLSMLSQLVRFLVSRDRTDPSNEQLLGLERRIKQTLDSDSKLLQMAMRELQVVVNNLGQHQTIKKPKNTPWCFADPTYGGQHDDEVAESSFKRHSPKTV